MTDPTAPTDATDLAQQPRPVAEADAEPPVAPPAAAHSLAGHVRATVGFLVLVVLICSFAYPALVTEIAQEIDPSAANGSLLHYDGNVVGSSLVAQNLSAPYLFWERPSLTDYNLTLGAATPPGPTDPAMAALLNETIAYLEANGWNISANATVPFWFVAPSASSIDPDIVPEAALIQVPRVAANTNLTALPNGTFDEKVAFLTALVNQHISQPPIPDLGVAFVNVLELDLALVAAEGP